MLVKRTSKNQVTLPRILLQAAGITQDDFYFEARYDERTHVILLKPVRVIIEEKIPEKAIEKFEQEALQVKEGDQLFKSRKEADKFLEERMKK